MTGITAGAAKGRPEGRPLAISHKPTESPRRRIDTRAPFSVVTISGTAAAYEGLAAGAGLAMPTTWTTYTGTFTTSSPLNSLYTIVIDMGTATATTGTGLTFVALGTGSYSGTTSALSLP